MKHFLWAILTKADAAEAYISNIVELVKAQEAPKHSEWQGGRKTNQKQAARKRAEQTAPVCQSNPTVSKTPQDKDNMSKEPLAPDQAAQQRPSACLKCGGPHRIQKCPEATVEEKRVGWRNLCQRRRGFGEQDWSKLVSRVGMSSPREYLVGTLQGLVDVKIVIETGADVNVVPRRMVDEVVWNRCA